MRKRLARVAGAFVDLGLDALPRSVCPGMRNLCPRRLSIAWLRSTGGLAFKNLGATKLPPGGERQAAVLRDRAVAWRHDRPHRASEMTTAPTPICAACTRLGPTPTASSGTRAAIADGIPEDIWIGGFDHRNLFRGRHSSDVARGRHEAVAGLR
jgi:hypothetical protein